MKRVTGLVVRLNPNDASSHLFVLGNYEVPEEKKLLKARCFTSCSHMLSPHIPKDNILSLDEWIEVISEDKAQHAETGGFATKKNMGKIWLPWKTGRICLMLLTVEKSWRNKLICLTHSAFSRILYHYGNGIVRDLGQRFHQLQHLQRKRFESSYLFPMGSCFTQVKHWFAAQGLSISDPELLWKILDTSSDGQLDLEELIQGTARLQGDGCLVTFLVKLKNWSKNRHVEKPA